MRVSEIPYISKGLIQLTGIPEFVLMPAPVTTTTFFAFNKALAIAWSCSSEAGVTCVVGILCTICTRGAMVTCQLGRR